MSLLRRGAPRAQCWSGGAELQATGGSTREAGDRGTRVRDQAGVRWGGGGGERRRSERAAPDRVGDLGEGSQEPRKAEADCVSEQVSA